jgi:hypothetical protein
VALPQEWWSEPFIKNDKIAYGLAIGLSVLAVLCWHDALAVRGKDQPFLVRLLGFPSI